jgi:integrase
VKSQADDEPFVVSPQRGLWARVYRRADRGNQWYAHIRVPRLDTRRKLGPASMTAAQAADEADERLSTYAHRLGRVSRVPTVEEAAREFIRWKSTTPNKRGYIAKRGTWRRYEGIIDNYLLDALGPDTPLDEVDDDDLVALHEQLMEETPGASSINQTATVLRGIWRRARKAYRYRGDDPTLAFERIGTDPFGPYDAFDPEEIVAILDHIDGLLEQALAGDPVDQPLVDQLTVDRDLIGWYADTGGRRSEGIGLTVRDVNLLHESFSIERSFTELDGAGTTKGKRGRPIPMTDEQIEVMTRRLAGKRPGDLVFPSPFTGEHLSGSAVTKRFKAYRDAAGVRPLPLHALRHAFGTHAVGEFEVHEVQDMMGHRSIETTRRYVHHRPVRGGGARLSRAFGRARRGQITKAETVLLTPKSDPNCDPAIDEREAANG